MEKQKPSPAPRPPRDSKHFAPELNPAYASVPSEAEQPGGGERVAGVLWEVAKTVGFIILAALLIRALVIQPFFVQGESMEPGFLDGDYLLVNQISYRLGQPQRGDVIVFKAPPEPDTNYIKRIVALPGETVELKEGRLLVSNDKHPKGVALQEEYIPAGIRTQPSSEQTKWTLTADQYFTVGDNRAPGKSLDSRAWGPVPKANIIGKAWFRAYPLARIGFIKHEKFDNLALTPLLDFRLAGAP